MPLRLDDGRVLLTYAEAARRLRTSIYNLKRTWLRHRWLRPTDYRRGGFSYIDAGDLAAAVELRKRFKTAQLLNPAQVAARLGLSLTKVAAQIRTGHLGEALPGSGLYALDDVNRLLLRLRGIPDPISLSAAQARLGERSRTRLQALIASGALEAVYTGKRRLWLSANAVDALARAPSPTPTRTPERTVTTRAAATYLALSTATIARYVTRGLLKPTSGGSYRTYRFSRATLAAFKARHSPGPHGPTLPRGLVRTEEAAQLLGVCHKTVEHYVQRGRLRPSYRATWGGHVAYGFSRRSLTLFAQHQLGLDRRAAILPKGLLSTPQAAAFLGIQGQAVRRYVRLGALVPDFRSDYDKGVLGFRRDTLRRFKERPGQHRFA